MLQDDLTEMLRRLDADYTSQPSHVVASCVGSSDTANLSSISGAWLRRPVASCLDDPTEPGLIENPFFVPDEIGDWCQVPGGNSHENPFPPQSVLTVNPYWSPFHYPSLVKKIEEDVPMDCNLVSPDLVQSFSLPMVLPEQLSSPVLSPTDIGGLMGLLQYGLGLS